ncbi:MAG: HAD family phosphatase, partial [Acidobacteria bacterium]|nr:HAD family phosphatase [Acidobacteriota bacterium]
MFENLRIHPALAFIFDMDGVIVESTELHTRAWDEYLSRQGIAANGIMSRMLGKRNDQIVHEVWGPDLPAGEVYRHGADKERLYRELVGTELDRHLVRGVREFVQAAHKAGVKCGLATNAEPLNVEFVVGGAGLKSCFGALVDGHQVKNAKPDPEVFLTAASRLGVRAENCIVFEDSPGG